MPRVIAALIRHGDYQQLPDTPSAHQPFPLTNEGQIQAHQAAGALRNIITDNDWSLCSSVDSSQLLRAWQTARIIINELDKSFSSSLLLNGFDELAERGLGSAANLTIKQIEDIVHHDPRFADLPVDWKSNSYFCLPLQGAESLMQAGERVASHLTRQMEALASSASTDTLKLFIGHGASIRHAAFHLGVLKFEQIAQLSMHHAQPIFLEYHQKGQWQQIAGHWKLRANHSEYTD
jgi:2,3-bisphosphoglycerate-dependent phosphoglycerate mutase